MENINTYSMLAGFFGGIISYVFGGWTALMTTLCILIILDFISGGAKSIYNKKLSSQLCYKGIIKKMMIFCIVAVANLVGKAIDVPTIRDIVVAFYIYNEALSIVENASEFIPVPQKLKDVLAQLKDKEESEEENDG